MNQKAKKRSTYDAPGTEVQEAITHSCLLMGADHHSWHLKYHISVFIYNDFIWLKNKKNKNILIGLFKSPICPNQIFQEVSVKAVKIP